MLAGMTNQRRPSSAEYAATPSAATALSGRAFGIDIGGTGIKAAVVDLADGHLVTDRMRELTPHPATVEAILDVVADVIRQLEVTGALTDGMPGGLCFPSVIRAGEVMTASNLDPSWIGANVETLLEHRLGRTLSVVNDADAAGVAETAYGAGQGEEGVVLLLDLGTGIGSALLFGGRLVPNIQLGHVELHGHEAESRVSPTARTRRKIGWRKWGREFEELLKYYESYLWPDLIIIGGGLARKFSTYSKFLSTRAPLVAASLGTNAGIVGAARVGASAAAASPGSAGSAQPVQAVAPFWLPSRTDRS